MSHEIPLITQDAIDGIPEPVFVLEAEGSCIFANLRLWQLIGCEPSHNRRADLFSFWPLFSVDLLGRDGCVAEFQLPSQECFPVQLEFLALPHKRWLVRVLAGSSESDNTRAFHQQRLETLGMLAGGIAHDFNNMLTGILGHITYLKTILPALGSHQESLVAIEDGARKASMITQQILNFSKLDPALGAERIELCDLVRRNGMLLRGAISVRFALEVDVPSEPIVVLGSESRLSQVLVNLVTNARDAIGFEVASGKIAIRLQTISDEGEIRAAFEGNDPSAQSYARLTVSDNGSGIDQEVLSRIFEPYFSTKGFAGTGLGLATVSAVVRDYGGAISIQSEAGKGTHVAVYLPIITNAAETTSRSGVFKAPSRLPGGSEHILIVDDEAPVRNVLSVSLQHLGYQVATASSGAEALQKYQLAREPYGLVILDMIMPKMSGDQVYKELRKIDPNARVLVISGYTSEESLRSILDHGGLGYIQKPFTIEELARQVRTCLDLTK